MFHLMSPSGFVLLCMDFPRPKPWIDHSAVKVLVDEHDYADCAAWRGFAHAIGLRLGDCADWAIGAMAFCGL
ncbi:MAG: hypothetical protein CL681_27060 [Blastopirellula sp.]|nr:hypothetical protein [Blastopirellula sp.]